MLWRKLSATILIVISGCGWQYDTLAPLSAQPKTPVARNITSFSSALQCMDRMLAKNNRPRTYISSTQIPDRTKRISVGSEDMLINSVAQMTRRSQSYVYVDQVIAKSSSGAYFDIEYKDTKSKYKPPLPKFYISGSISQLDSSARSAGYDIGFGADDLADTGISDADLSGDRNNSVVTVDLHLVAFPSRRVVSGGSVSNSMVVTRKSFGKRLTGKIVQETIGVSFQIDRLESTGQAVRNLIDLGVIELLGQHARLPYWECLSLESTVSRKNARKEILHVAKTQPVNLGEAQSLLLKLGRLNTNYRSGVLDSTTRRALAAFQAQHQLVATGEADFDTLQALRNTVEQQTPPKKVKKKRLTKTVAKLPKAPSTEGYQSIGNYIK